MKYLCALVLWLIHASTAYATTCLWTYPSGGNWFVNPNGSPSVVPGAGDTAIFSNAGIQLSAAGRLSGIVLFADTNAFCFPYRFYRTTN